VGDLTVGKALRGGLCAAVSDPTLSDPLATGTDDAHSGAHAVMELGLSCDCQSALSNRRSKLPRGNLLVACNWAQEQSCSGSKAVPVAQWSGCWFASGKTPVQRVKLTNAKKLASSECSSNPSWSNFGWLLCYQGVFDSWGGEWVRKESYRCLSRQIPNSRFIFDG